MSIETEKSEVMRRAIPFGRIAEIASTPDSVIWPSDASSYFAGRSIAPDKATRIRMAAAALIDLYDNVRVKPNWRSPENVREALAALAEFRKGATAPWSASRAIVEFEAGQRSGSASKELAGSKGNGGCNRGE